MLQAPRLCPCERQNVPAADAAACTAATIAGMAGVAVAAPPTGAIIFGVDAVAAAAGVAAAVNTSDFDRPEGGRWCRGIAFRYSPVSGSRSCHWRLACCGWDGPQPGHVEVELAVLVCRPPSSLSYAPSPLTPSPAVDSPLRQWGAIAAGAGKGQERRVTSNIAGGQYGAVGSEHSHTVAGVVDTGFDVVAVSCFRLRLIFSLYSVDGRLEERPYFPGERR